jgi:hypothetical protein
MGSIRFISTSLIFFFFCTNQQVHTFKDFQLHIFLLLYFVHLFLLRQNLQKFYSYYALSVVQVKINRP